MAKWIFWLVMLGSMLACVSFATAPTIAPTQAPEPTQRPPQYSRYTLGDVELGLNTPYGWETYATESLVILAEHSGSITNSDELRGMIVHIFVHPLDSFTIPTSDQPNLALTVLNQIVRQPDYVGEAAVSEPVGFLWDNHDAGYYLIQHDANSALLLALTLPDLQKLLICSFSAPVQDSYRIRQMLPRLLEGFTLEGERMDVNALLSLPDPLRFPS
jgi:hypothetical protein